MRCLQLRRCIVLRSMLRYLIVHWITKHLVFLIPRTRLSLPYCGRLYITGGNSGDLIIAIYNTINLMMSFASFFAASEDGQVKDLFGYRPFGVHNKAVTELLSEPLMSNDNRVRLASLVTFYGFDGARSRQVSKRSVEIDRNSYIGETFSFSGYVFGTGVVSSVPATSVSKRLKIRGAFVVLFRSQKVYRLRADGHAIIENCEQE